MRNPECFSRPGVNPQSMSPEVSGDSILTTVETDYGQQLIGIIDGAWVRGFDHAPSAVPDIAQWSSRTIAHLLANSLYMDGDTCHTMSGLFTSVARDYQWAVASLKVMVGYKLDLPPAYADLNPLKIGPQSAFAVALFNPNGTIDIAQVRDCLVVAEMVDGTMHRLTPNQSELVATAGDVLGIQNEKAAVNAYQALAQEIILSGEWATRRHEVAEIARRVHKEAFFDAWRQTDAELPDDLAGQEGFNIWRQAVETLCLCYNSATFNNNPGAPEVLLPDGTKAKAAWAMFTGESDMFPLTYAAHLTDLTGMKALWIMSDGAFKQGDRGEDLNAMRAFGPERYYEEVLLPRFDGSTPARKRYHADRVPMDVTIVRIPLI